MLRGSKQDDEKAPLQIFVRHLGLLGPQGALPLATTEEAYHYALAGDDAFPRFLDLFNHRFIQLFFRAWADARPIAQHDRPDADRFVAYVGSAIGIGSAPYRNLDTVPDAAKLGFAGLLGAQAKSASRLRRRDPWHVQRQGRGRGIRRLAPRDSRRRSGPGSAGDTMCSARTPCSERSIFSVQDKIRIRIFTRDLAQYIRFLPTGDLCEPMADLVFFYSGEQLEYDVELAIPAGAAEPIRLGRFGQLGWTTWMAPNWTSSEAYRRDARFHPAERMRHKRKRAQQMADREGRSDGGH